MHHAPEDLQTGWELEANILLCLQDCGKPWYVENYIAFFSAIRSRYPHMRLISNCDMDVHAPTDLFDWHMYTNSENMFERRHDFDRTPPGKQVFASEYAVFDDTPGQPLQFPGNIKVSARLIDGLSFFVMLCFACH